MFIQVKSTTWYNVKKKRLVFCPVVHVEFVYCSPELDVDLDADAENLEKKKKDFTTRWTLMTCPQVCCCTWQWFCMFYFKVIILIQDSLAHIKTHRMTLTLITK